MSLKQYLLLLLFVCAPFLLLEVNGQAIPKIYKIKINGDDITDHLHGQTYELHIDSEEILFEVFATNDGDSNAPVGFGHITIGVPNLSDPDDTERIELSTGSSRDIEDGKFLNVFCDHVVAEGYSVNEWEPDENESLKINIDVRGKESLYFLVRSAMSYKSEWDYIETDPGYTGFLDCIDHHSYYLKVDLIRDEPESSIPNFKVRNVSIDNTYLQNGAQVSIECDQYGYDLSKDYDPKLIYVLSLDEVYDSNDHILGEDKSSLDEDDKYDTEKITATIPSNWPDGKSYIIIVSDFNNQYQESNENDNAHVTPIQVVNPSPTIPTLKRINPVSSEKKLILGQTELFIVNAQDNGGDISSITFYANGEQFHYRGFPDGASNTSPGATFQADTPGSFRIESYVFDRSGNSDYVFWNVIVEEPVPTNPWIGEIVTNRDKGDDGYFRLSKSTFSTFDRFIYLNHGFGFDDYLRNPHERFGGKITVHNPFDEAYKAKLEAKIIYPNGKEDIHDFGISFEIDAQSSKIINTPIGISGESAPDGEYQLYFRLKEDKLFNPRTPEWPIQPNIKVLISDSHGFSRPRQNATGKMFLYDYEAVVPEIELPERGEAYLSFAEKYNVLIGLLEVASRLRVAMPPLPTFERPEDPYNIYKRLIRQAAFAKINVNSREPGLTSLGFDWKNVPSLNSPVGDQRYNFDRVTNVVEIIADDSEEQISISRGFWSGDDNLVRSKYINSEGETVFQVYWHEYFLEKTLRPYLTTPISNLTIGHQSDIEVRYIVLLEHGPFKELYNSNEGGVISYDHWSQNPSSAYWLTMSLDYTEKDIGGTYIEGVDPDLFFNQAGQVEVTLKAKKSGDFYVAIQPDDGWAWENLTSDAQYIQKNDRAKFSFPVTPNSESLEVEVAVYKKVFGTFFWKKETSTRTLYVTHHAPKITSRKFEVNENSVPEITLEVENLDGHAFEMGLMYNDLFDMAGNQLILKPNAQLDFESNDHVMLQAYTAKTDYQDIGDTVDIDIAILNVNETPSITGLTANTFDENNELDVSITEVKVEDQDSNDHFVLSLPEGEGDNEDFIVEGHFIYTKAPLNYEEKQNYELVIEAIDQGGLSSTRRFDLTINNVNESPVISGLTSENFPENNKIGSTLTGVTVFDEDENDQSSVHLPIGQGDNEVFEVVGYSILAKESFNYEEKDTYELVLEVTDQGGLSTTKSFDLTIDDINEQPVISGLTLDNFTENNEAGAVITEVMITDEDTNDEHAIHLAVGHADNDYFEVSDHAIIATEPFNFEVKNAYTLVVEVIDQGGLSASRSFSLTVNDINEPPVIGALTADSFYENNVSGVQLAEVIVTDEDANDQTIIYLPTDLGDNNDFVVIGRNAIITKESFDFEVKNSYELVVEAVDQDGLVTTKSFDLTVDNVNEQPTIDGLTLDTFSENNTPGVVLTEVTISDEDENDTHVVRLVPEHGDNDFFEVEGHAILAKESFNFEEKNAFKLMVEVTDQGGLVTTKSFNLWINDVNEAPVIGAIPVDNFAENNVTGLALTEIQFEDEDIGDQCIVNLPTELGDNHYFEVVGHSIFSKEPFNYEEKKSYEIVVEVIDQGGLHTTRNFDLIVNDVNEAPVIRALTSNSFQENNEVGLFISEIIVEDEDEGDQCIIHLPTEHADNAVFGVVGHSIMAKEAFNFEDKNRYEIIMEVVDNGGLKTIEAFEFSIDDENEAPSHLSLSSYFLENLTEYIEMEVEDEDRFESHVFSLVDGDSSNHNYLFQINNNHLTFSWDEIKELQEELLTIRVQATDKDLLSLEKVFTLEKQIVLNADKPFEPSNYTDLVIYPNPGLSVINVLNKDIHFDQLSIIDPMGRRISVDVLRSKNGIDISNLSPATYIIEGYKGSQFFRGRFIKID